MLPLTFDRAQIDGDPEAKWIAAQDADQKAAWPAEQEFISKAFQTAVTDDVGRLKITTKENPEGATFVVRLPRADVEYPKLREAAAFFCTNGTCSLPVSTPEKLAQKLARSVR